jgi:hypothetical protein
MAEMTPYRRKWVIVGVAVMGAALICLTLARKHIERPITATLGFMLGVFGFAILTAAFWGVKSND